MKTFPIRSFHMVFQSGTAFAFVSSLVIVVRSSVVHECVSEERVLIRIARCVCEGLQVSPSFYMPRRLDLTVAHCLFLRYLPQVEIKMKKTEAIRWEKLEGEDILPNLKHFSPSPSQYQEAHISSSKITSAWKFPSFKFLLFSLIPLSHFRPVPVILPLHPQLGQAGGWY